MIDIKDVDAVLVKSNTNSKVFVYKTERVDFKHIRVYKTTPMGGIRIKTINGIRDFDVSKIGTIGSLRLLYLVRI